LDAIAGRRGSSGGRRARAIREDYGNHRDHRRNQKNIVAVHDHRPDAENVQASGKRKPYTIMVASEHILEITY